MALSTRVTAPTIKANFVVHFSSPSSLAVRRSKRMEKRRRRPQKTTRIPPSRCANERSAAVSQFAMHSTGPPGNSPSDRQFGKEVSIQAASLDVRLNVGRPRPEPESRRRFSGGARSLTETRQLQVDVAGGSVRMTLHRGQHFDITVTVCRSSTVSTRHAQACRSPCRYDGRAHRAATWIGRLHTLLPRPRFVATRVAMEMAPAWRQPDWKTRSQDRNPWCSPSLPGEFEFVAESKPCTSTVPLTFCSSRNEVASDRMIELLC